MANMYRTTPKQIAKALRDNGQVPNVISNLRQRKAMQFIIENMAGAKDDKVDDDKPAAADTVEDEKADSADDKPVDDKVDEKKVEE